MVFSSKFSVDAGCILLDVIVDLLDGLIFKEAYDFGDLGL